MISGDVGLVTRTPTNRLFKIYISVMLLIITLLLAALVGGLVYAGKHVDNEVNNTEQKVDALNHNLNNLDSGLNSVDNQLKQDASINPSL